MQDTALSSEVSISFPRDEISARRCEAAFEQAVAAIKILAQLGTKEGSFEGYERATLEALNEIGRRCLEQELQRIADAQPKRLDIDGYEHRRHMPGTLTYHSLCGPLSVRRYTYRPCNERNGVTVVPLDVEARLIRHATPALSFAVLQAGAKAPLRSFEEDLRALHRYPVSRSTMDRMMVAVADDLQDHVIAIEQELREDEEVPVGAYSISLGLDRVATPIEELRRDGEGPNTRRKKREKPYIRKPRPPVNVKYEMAYVATVSILDNDTNAMVIRRYAATANEGPSRILTRMMDDLANILRQRPSLQIVVVQDGAPELWRLMSEALLGAGIKRGQWLGIVDRFHVVEHLADALDMIEPDVAKRRSRLAAWNHDLDARDSAVAHIADELDYLSATVRGAKRDRVAQHCTYLWGIAVAKQGRYASFRRNRLPTGSGITEGACKSLVCARANRSGQRWHVRGLQAVLTLRALYQSARLKSAWQKYQERIPAQVRAAL